ncbi:MAG: hypothetical protein JSR80_03530 [Verrucomicrobia bacterium]|nr:hypothetical protein [Verrucomicrobiota bacterium]
MECSRVVKRNCDVYSLSRVGVVAVCFGIGCYLLIQNAAEQKLADLEKYKNQLAQLDPAKLEAWQKATQYEAICKQLRSDYLDANLLMTKELETYWTTTYVRTGSGLIPIPIRRSRWITHSRFAEYISQSEFTELLRKNAPLYESFQKACSLVNKTSAEALESIFLGKIPLAGSSPVPVLPTFDRLYLWMRLELLLLCTLGIGGLCLWR